MLAGKKKRNQRRISKSNSSNGDIQKLFAQTGAEAEDEERAGGRARADARAYGEKSRIFQKDR